MTPFILNYLCDPYLGTDLKLVNEKYDESGNIESGLLVSETGKSYPIINGIPRFIKIEESPSLGAQTESVTSFGDQWNEFNFDMHYLNWIEHTVKNTFGDTSAFKDKLVVDCGAGSGMQSKWMSECGANHVIALELSHSVDNVMQKNLQGIKNVDIIQCSIDMPPIKKNSINGIVICHNVIQHTPSVEKTALALWEIVGTNGEFVFNCYPKNDKGIIRKLRLKIYSFIRSHLSRKSFSTILLYSRIMSTLRFIPILGFLLEKSGAMARGDVPKGENYFRRAFHSGVLNTFDCYGSHQFQHLLSNEQVMEILKKMQPDFSRIKNFPAYFSRPQPIGVALRVEK